MKLKKEGINKTLLNSLITIQNDSLFKDYYLAGGTALSLHIGHRISEDIDLFTNNNMDKQSIISFIKENVSKDTKIINDSNYIFQLYSENKKLKIDFVHEPYKPIENIIETEKIRLIGLNDISAMKISAAGTRGSEAKDFIDIFYLLKIMNTNKMFENFKKRYGTNDILHYVRSAMYFDDVKDSSWNAIKMINDDLNVSEIKKTIIKEIGNYQKRELRKFLKNN